MTQMLPEPYQELDAFAAEWCLETQDERHRKRRNSTSEELRRFYNAVTPHIRGILEEVDRYPLGSLPQSHRALFALALSYAEVAPNIELYGGMPNVPNAFDEGRMKARHGNEKTWQGHRSR